MRVWFNGRTEAFQASDAGSIPVTRSIESAQVRLMIRLACLLYRHFGTWRSLVARLLWEQDVAGSNPVVPTSRGCGSMVELKPSKLLTRVRFPSPAPRKPQARAQLALAFLFCASARMSDACQTAASNVRRPPANTPIRRLIGQSPSLAIARHIRKRGIERKLDPSKSAEGASRNFLHPPVDLETPQSIPNHPAA